ncbi:MAG: hypothetical protein ACYCPT_12220 [Acidimicrobiales bacterium]
MSRINNQRAIEAAKVGNLADVKYAISNLAHNMQEITCHAARYGHANIVLYMGEQYNDILDWNEICAWAVAGGHENIFYICTAKGANQYQRFATQAISGEKKYFDLLKRLIMPHLTNVDQYVIDDLHYYSQTDLANTLSS